MREGRISGEAFEAAADAVVSGDAVVLQAIVARSPGLAVARSPRDHGAMLIHYVAVGWLRREADSVRAMLNGRPELVGAWLTGNSWPNEFAGMEACEARGYETPRSLDPLAYATVLGAAGCVEVLIAAGASFETLSHGADMGWCTPLVQAAFQNKAAVLFILLRAGTNPNIMGSAGSSALMMAAEHGRSAMVDALLAAGARPTIHVAALLGDLGEVDRWLTKSPAWLEAKDPYRQASRFTTQPMPIRSRWSGSCWQGARIPMLRTTILGRRCSRRFARPGAT